MYPGVLGVGSLSILFTKNTAVFSWVVDGFLQRFGSLERMGRLPLEESVLAESCLRGSRNKKEENKKRGTLSENRRCFFHSEAVTIAAHSLDKPKVGHGMRVKVGFPHLDLQCTGGAL